jgi:hypothetical protein
MKHSSAVTITALGALVWACSGDGSRFRGGGDNLNPDYTPPPEDTGSADTDVADTGDSASSLDTADSDTAVIDTAADFEGEGYDDDDIAYNLVAPDQEDDEWRLYQQTSGPVLLVFGHAWDSNLTAIAEFLPGLASDYETYGLTVALMLFEDLNTKAADVDDAAAFAASTGLEVVLYDDDASRESLWSPVQPTTYVISSDMEIQWKNTGISAATQVEDQIRDLVF